MDIETIRGNLREAQRQLGNSPPSGARFQEPPPNAPKADIRAWAKDLQARAGIAWDYMEQSIGLLGAEPGPEPDPEPEPAPAPQPAPAAVLSGFGGTYSGHGLARDCYLGTDPEMVAWGPHHGLDLLALAAGKVERYQFGTPISLPRDHEAAQVRMARHDALFDGWICIVPPVNAGAPWLVGAQTMFVAVFWPDAPIRLEGAQQAKAIWFGHVRGDVAEGRVAAGDRIATSFDSGIRFENQGLQVRAAHVHVCGSATGQLSPNGDVDGFLVARALGWDVWNRGTIAGPNEYMAGTWIAGRPQREWANRPLPPMPGG